MNYSDIKKETIEFIVSELVDNLDEVEKSLRDLPVDFGDRKDGFQEFLEKFFTQDSFEQRIEK